MLQIHLLHIQHSAYILPFSMQSSFSASLRFIFCLSVCCGSIFRTLLKRRIWTHAGAPFAWRGFCCGCSIFFHWAFRCRRFLRAVARHCRIFFFTVLSVIRWRAFSFLCLSFFFTGAKIIRWCWPPGFFRCARSFFPFSLFCFSSRCPTPPAAPRTFAC